MQARKRSPITPSTAAGFGSYLRKWLYPNLGGLPLSSVNNLVVRGLVTKMTEAGLSAKMVNNVVQVVKMVVASAVNEDGEQVHPRTWNHEFIDLPEVKDQRQPTFTSEAMKAITARSEERERMLYVLLGAAGMRIGEALGIEIDKHFPDDFSTLLIRQKVWNGRVQSFLKTENGVRDIDLASVHREDTQEICWEPKFGFSVLLKERKSSSTVEHLETFATPDPRGTETT